ncbi:MAG: hypothetical protein ACREDM_09070 [Methylocella sp.]
MSGINVDTLCGGNKEKVPRNSAVPEIAQLYALGLFREDFRSRYPVGETFSEWDLVGSTSIGTGRSASDMVLRQIKSDFRNYYAKNKTNRARIKAGVPASGLVEGRSVRADGLGLALDPLQGALVAELMEVTTDDEADDTLIEDIQPKVALLRGPIKTLVERALSEARMATSSMLPDKFIAYGTPWVIPAPLAVVPIFQDPKAITPNSKYRWICFAPTYKYRPFPFGGMLGSTGEPEMAPARGLIAYSYHQANTPQAVPEEVVQRFKEWLKQQQRRYQRLELLPLPEMSRYWQDNNDDLKIMLSFLALATAAVVVVVLAIYLAPIVAGAAASGLTALGAATSIEAIGAQSAALVALISATVPQTMTFSRTAVQSVANLDPQLRIVF